MEMTGSRQIMAPRDEVWAALNSAEVLRVCIPGCEALTGSPDQGFEATVRQKIGPVGATFEGTIRLSNVVQGQGCTLTGEGKGGAAGFAKGSADVALSDAEGGTRLEYSVTAHLEGRLAQLGGRLVDGFARKTADAFFDGFQLAVEGPIEPPAPADVTEESGEPKSGWFKRLIGRSG